MTPSEIHKALTEVRQTFPKSSKMYVAYVERYDKTGALEGGTQLGSVIAMKSAWQLENKAPTVTFLPTDGGVIEYARKIAAGAEQSKCKMMIVIDLQHALTSVYVVSKGACFIATAACGDPFAPEVIALTAFRDEVLLQSRTGRILVRLYYAVSRPVAAVIARSSALRCGSMALVVRPAVRLVRRFRETVFEKQK